jgi:hypothetical protein
MFKVLWLVRGLEKGGQVMEIFKDFAKTYPDLDPDKLAELKKRFYFVRNVPEQVKALIIASQALNLLCVAICDETISRKDLIVLSAQYTRQAAAAFEASKQFQNNMRKGK